MRGDRIWDGFPVYFRKRPGFTPVLLKAVIGTSTAFITSFLKAVSHLGGHLPSWGNHSKECCSLAFCMSTSCSFPPLALLSGGNLSGVGHQNSITCHFTFTLLLGEQLLSYCDNDSPLYVIEQFLNQLPLDQKVIAFNARDEVHAVLEV